MKTEQLQVSSQIASRDWLIMQSALPRLASAMISAPATANEIGDDLADWFELRPPMTMDQDGIATIHIHSVLVDSAPAIYEKLGIVNRYETIEAEITAALDANASGILLVIDSPGGTVRGNVETSEMVADLPIPSVAFCKGLTCSAAYKIAAGTDMIIANPSAVVGNIGSILSWMNAEQFWSSMGVKFEALTSEGADLKSTFHTEPNAEQREFLQDNINQAGEQFRAHVTAGREAAGATVDPEVWRAGWYSGERAGALGLIDGIGGIAEARVALLSLIDTP